MRTLLTRASDTALRFVGTDPLVASRITSGLATIRGLVSKPKYPHIVCGRELPLGRKFELVFQTPESCLIAYSVVTGEHHRRSQERIVFGQSCL